MSWLIFGFTITILISNVSSYTTIPGDTTWIDTVDNTEPNYYQTRTDAETGDGNYWYYPEYVPERVNDQGGLAGVTGTVPGTGEAVWGWWNYWNQDGSRDPDRSMVRSFTCGSVGTVEVSFNFWMCTSNSNTALTWKRISSQGLVTDAKTYGGGCFSANSGAWGQNPAGTQCTGINIKRCQVSETFITEGPLDTIVLQFMFAAYSNSPGQTYHTGAMNGLQVKCIRRETESPTRQPTSTTNTPSIPPSKTPSKTPTESPTPAPTGNPTRNPTTHKPTASPTTPIPSKFPSKHPTPDPTQSPTIDPTNNPTPRPTARPNPRPTGKPTRKRGLSHQFAEAFGVAENDCTGSWIVCNIVVFIILLLVVICCILYWILGGAWYIRRQNNRPLPPSLMNQEHDDSVEMGTGIGGVQTHTTSDKWKSQWELEQEAKAQLVRI
eukprot:494157_1